MIDSGYELDPPERDVVLPATLAVLPLKDTVVFPQTVTTLAIGQPRSVALIDDVVSGARLLGLLTARDPSIESPGWDDIYRVGTLAVVHKMIKFPDGTLQILVGGLQRVALVEPTASEPFLVGRLEALPDENAETPEVEALTRNIQTMFARIIGLAPYLPAELQLAVSNLDDPSALAHLVASTLRIPTRNARRSSRRSTSSAGCGTSRQSLPARSRYSSSARRSSRRFNPRWTRASASTSYASS